MVPGPATPIVSLRIGSSTVTLVLVDTVLSLQVRQLMALQAKDITARCAIQRTCSCRTRGAGWDRSCGSRRARGPERQIPVVLSLPISAVGNPRCTSTSQLTHRASERKRARTDRKGMM